MAAEFIPVSAINDNIGQVINIAGVVVDIRPPAKTRGEDFMVTFILCDKSKSLVENGLTVRYFHRTKEQLPDIQGLDDVVILRNVKVNNYNGKPIVISHFNSTWIVGGLSPIRKEFIIRTSGSSVKATSREVILINTLREFWKNRGGAAASRGLAPQALPKVEAVKSHKRKFAHIKDMQYDHFYDLMGEVVKTFPGAGNFTVYLTDYTRNPNLHCYDWPNTGEHSKGTVDDDEQFYTGRSGISNSKWTGPYGQYTLQITLWDVHADAARKIVKDGCLLQLNNVRAKRNGDGKMEGSLHGDRKYPERVDIAVVKDLKDPLVSLLSRRKIEHRRRSETERTDYEKRYKKDDDERTKREQAEVKEAAELNQYIITLKADGIPTILVGDILQPVDIDLNQTPYSNRKYKTICRVVDFLPNKLEQFCRRVEPQQKKTHVVVRENGKIYNVYEDGSERPAPEGDDEEEEDDDDDDEVPESQRNQWEFRFALLVEGKDGATMRLMVDDKAAQFLLKMDPTDLRANPAALAELREKLFVLWGDLEERKTRKLRRLQDKEKEKKGIRSDSRKRKSTSKQNPKKRRKSNKHGDGGGDDSAGSDDSEQDDSEEENGLIVGRGLFFSTLVREYGVQRTSENGKTWWDRMFGLFGVMIK